jgi:ABC-2 type transport system ATP-binding protein
VTILLTTHDLGDVERLADRVAILDRGRIVALGTPTELTGGASPTVRVRVATLPAATQLAAVRAALATSMPGAALDPDPGAGPAHLRLTGAPPSPAAITAVAAACAAADLTIIELRTGSGSLEERYLELTGDAAVERATDRDAVA